MISKQRGYDTPNLKRYKDPIEMMNDRDGDICYKTNVQSQFLRKAKPEDFSFIGITDQYEQSVERFKKIAPESKTREWDKNFRKNAAARDNIEIKDEWIQEIKERNSNDIELYNKFKRVISEKKELLHN